MKILAGSNQEKVLALAQLTEDLLDELGYTDCHPKLSAAHLTIELKARHRSSGHRLHCYGCTLAHEIPLRDLQGAHKRYALARAGTRTSPVSFFLCPVSI